MSYKASDWAVAQPVDNASAKLVLLILAHHRNHKTGRCFPSIATIALETGLSPRGVRYAIARLAAQGLIELRGSTTRRHYHLNVTTAAPAADVPRETEASDAGVTIDTAAHPATTLANAAADCGTPCPLTGKQQRNNREGEETLAPGIIENSKKTRMPARATRLSADWQPSAEGTAFAQREHPDLEWRREAQAFRDYWLAKPGRDGESADWEASWRRWLGQAERFAPKPDRYSSNHSKRDRGEPWLQRVESYRLDNTWLPMWAGPPGSGSQCRVPPEILRQFGYPVYERGELVPPPAAPTDSPTKAAQ